MGTVIQMGSPTGQSTVCRMGTVFCQEADWQMHGRFATVRGCGYKLELEETCMGEE